MFNSEQDLNRYYMQKYCNYQLRGNFFLDMNPLVKMYFFLALGVIGIFLPSFKEQIVLCAAFYLMAAAGKRFGKFAKLYTAFLIMIVGYMLIVRQLSVAGEKVLFSVFGWKWTYEALVNALDLSFTLSVFSGAVILFFVFTEMRDLMCSFEKLGVSHEASYIVLASFQTIVDLKKTAQTIMDSQRARGVETEGNFWRRAKALLPVLSPTFLSALSSTEEKTISMDARAFSIERKHSFLRELRPVQWYEKLLLVIVTVVLAAMIIWMVI